MSWLLSLCLALAGAESGTAVTRIGVVNDGFELVRVEPVDSTPPKFVLLFQREMPTPGWQWRIDDLAIDESGRRMVIRVTEVPPAGIVAQVLSPTEFHVPVGRPSLGRWVVELRTRRGGGEHRPVFSSVLEAS